MNKDICVTLWHMEENKWKDWEACEWHCTCGHPMKITLTDVSTDENNDQIGTFKARCNNCTLVRIISINASA